ncbi:MAG: hypothetical protein NC396_07670 [Bacteroides sp.]|nr:hypothetical protein [Bacteroides sp.]MCM1086167.1 hypothetical protein [Bacteroides sp.]
MKIFEFIRFFVLSTLFLTGIRLYGQSSNSDLQIPVVNKLPSWYWTQRLGQAIGISMIEDLGNQEAAREQAVYFARMRAALMEPDTNTISGNILTATISNTKENKQTLHASATLKLPNNYEILEQCRLKNGTVLVLLQYRYSDLSETENLLFESDFFVRNDTIYSDDFFMAIKGKFEVSGDGSPCKDGYEWDLYHILGTPLYDAESTFTLHTWDYYTITHNLNLLNSPNELAQPYIGWLNFDNLRQQLYRKLFHK